MFNLKITVMKKLIALVLVLCTTLPFANAQKEKGTVFLGTTTSITGNYYDMIYGTNNSSGITFIKSKDSDEKYTVINFAPKIGYFIEKNFVLGANIKFWNEGQNVLHATHILAGPFARYYILSGKVVPFLEAETLFGSIRYTWDSTSYNDDKKNLSMISISAGLAIFLNDHINIDILMGCRSNTSKYKDSDYDDKTTINNIGLSIGFTFLL